MFKTGDRECCVNSCGSTNLTKRMFTFPKVHEGQVNKKNNIERCKAWVMFANNDKLKGLPLMKLHRRFFMCSDHFDDRQFCQPLKRERLLRDAIPSVKKQIMNTATTNTSKTSVDESGQAEAKSIPDSSFVSNEDFLLRLKGNMSCILKNSRGNVAVDATHQDKCSKNEILHDVHMEIDNFKVINENSCSRYQIFEDLNDELSPCENMDLDATGHSNMSKNEILQYAELRTDVPAGNSLEVVKQSSCGTHQIFENVDADTFSVRTEENAVTFSFTNTEYESVQFASEGSHQQVAIASLSNSVQNASKNSLCVMKNDTEQCELNFHSNVGDKQQADVEMVHIVSDPDAGTVCDTATPRKRSQRKCCAFSCSPSNVSHFAFPSLKTKSNGKYLLDLNKISRCALWLKNSGNQSLLDTDILEYHNRFYLCARHFEDDQFICPINKNRLMANAIPTLFDCDSLSEEDVSSHIQNVKALAENFDSYVENENEQSMANFEDQMNTLGWFSCNTCREKHMVFNPVRSSCVHGKKCQDFSEQNNMDPGNVPEVLSELTFIEEQLIARIHPFISVFKLKGQQYGYSGNVINFSQDVKQLSKELPHKIKDLSSVLIVNFKNQKSGCKQFQVRAAKILSALLWLKDNNIYYKDVEISYDNLNLLPQDYNVYDELNSITTDETDLECTVDPTTSKGSVECENSLQSEHGSSIPTEKDEIFNENSRLSFGTEEDDISDIYHTGVPLMNIPHANDQVKSNILDWPTMDSNPISEFTTVGYIAMAFPSLFPTGKADFRAYRDKKIGASDYFKHLLNYHDQRFAQHQTFRFFCFNSWMRWNALTDGKLFIQKNQEFNSMNLAQLKDLLREKPNTIKKMMFQASNLRGTKAFWSSRCSELTDMVEQLGLPTIFLTLSSADLHWHDLFRLLCKNEDEIKNLTEKQRRDLLKNNPHIVDTFFSKRVECFITTVLKPRFKVKDYWYRVEYQHRGSPHVHGVFWLDGAPDVSCISTASTEELQRIAEYFDFLISAVNPDPSCDDANTHPCRVLLREVTDSEEDLAQLLAKVQRHTKCSPDYCLKINRKSRKLECRFKFPIEMQELCSIITTDTGDIEFRPARNDTLLNKFNRLIISLWRANIDISPVLSKTALLRYLAKYISKSEVKSSSLIELLSSLLEDLDDSDSARIAVQKLYIKTCSERDFSAQEVCHIVAGHKLYSAGGRSFTFINLTEVTNWVEVPQSDSSGNGCKKKGRSVVEKYQDRPTSLEHVSLWEAGKFYNSSKWSKNKISSILRIFPKVHLSGDENADEQFYRQKVLLHVPWRCQENLYGNAISWKQLYDDKNVCALQQLHLDLHSSKNIPDEEEYTSDEDEDEPSDIENLEEWMVASRLAPNSSVPAVQLGTRDLDLSHDWSKAYKDYEIYGSMKEFQSFIQNHKEQCVEETPDKYELPDVSFSNEQLQIIKLIDQQINFCKQNAANDATDLPKRILIQGKAGTGKSLLISYITTSIIIKLGSSSYILLGPTGVAALNINGQTIHSIMKIPMKKKKFKSLTGEAARKLCNLFENVSFIIIDEYSMIGCKMLDMIDQRCRQAKGIDEPFGGMFVYLLGDIRQLPPIKDTPLYCNADCDETSQRGKALLKTFQAAFILQKCFRQQDPLFQTLLDNISIGNIYDNDYDVLRSRFICSATIEEKMKFEDAIHLFATKDEVFNCNIEKLKNLQYAHSEQLVPVARIVAKHNSKAASKGTTEDAGGLQSVLYLAKGCKVMLRCNLWTKKGLVNGAIGEIVDILYDKDQAPPDGFPEVLMCRFSGYKGPGLGPNNDIIPIRSILKSWTSSKNEKCTRIQFPLVLSYGCSIHKSQGLTLDKAVINIGEKEFALGLTYVALSRVKSLKGILLEPFNMQRINRLKNSNAMTMRAKFLSYLTDLSKHCQK